VTGADGKPAIEVIANLNDPSIPVTATPVSGTSGSSRATWLPDGRILFEVGGHGLWVVEEDGTGLQQLVPNGNGASVSPDGSEIAYVVATGQADAPAYQIHVRSADGGTERTILQDPAIGPQMVAWSPDGSKLAFYGWVLPDGRYDVFVMDPHGSKPTQLTLSDHGAGSFAPSWSPDGTRIAFVSDRAGSVGIYVMNADGGDQKLILANGTQPAWQP
jgi:Tol biopolymer transport system component